MNPKLFKNGIPKLRIHISDQRSYFNMTNCHSVKRLHQYHIPSKLQCKCAVVRCEYTLLFGMYETLNKFRYSVKVYS